MAATCATVAAVALFLLPPVAGLDRYLIEGGSMEPTIPKGSMAYERRVPVTRLRTGDVITFVRPGGRRPITHRIIAIDRSAGARPVLRTRGDANRTADLQPLRLDSAEQARLAFHVPLVGWPLMALQDPERRRLLLIGADRIDAVESHLASFVTTRPDNPITETGVLSEFTHNGWKARVGTNRVDNSHAWIDSVLVAGPWVAAAVLMARLGRALDSRRRARLK